MLCMRFLIPALIGSNNVMHEVFDICLGSNNVMLLDVYL